MDENVDLAEVWINFVKDLPYDVEYTWDDFFEIIGVPKEERSDFLVASIIKQAQEKYNFQVDVE